MNGESGAVAWHDPYNGDTERLAEDAAAQRAKLCTESSRNAAEPRIHVDYHSACYVRERDGAARSMFTGERLGNVPAWYLERLRRRAADARRSTETPQNAHRTSKTDRGYRLLRSTETSRPTVDES